MIEKNRINDLQIVRKIMSEIDAYDVKVTCNHDGVEKEYGGYYKCPVCGGAEYGQIDLEKVMNDIWKRLNKLEKDK